MPAQIVNMIMRPVIARANGLEATAIQTAIIVQRRQQQTRQS